MEGSFVEKENRGFDLISKTAFGGSETAVDIDLSRLGVL